MFHPGYNCFADVALVYGEDHILAAYSIPFGEWIQSPLPNREDSTPSFITNKSGKSIMWRDFGYPPGRQPKGNLVTLVSLIEGLNDGPKLAKIIIQRLKSTPVPRPNITRQSAEVAGVEYSLHYTKDEMKYWKQFGMTREYLLSNNYFVCKKLTMDGRIIWKSVINKPTYVYIDDGPKNIWQAYRPYNNKGEKHISWQTEKLLLGKHFVSHYKHLVFNKSIKDTLVTRKIGLQSVNYGGETVIPSEEFAAKTLKFFKRVYCYMDNDTTGMAITKEYEALGFIPLLNPPGTPKDPSDYVLSLGYDSLIKNLKSQM